MAQRLSHLGYLPFVALAVVVPPYLQYLWQYPLPQIPVVLGQAPGIWSGFILTGLAMILWTFAPWRIASPTLLIVVLGLLLLLWVWQMAMSFLHQDAFTYGVWLYPALILMFLVKMPSSTEVRRTLLLVGWILTVILVLTRVLELLNVIRPAMTSPDLVIFEKANYWLPLSGWLGPEGRWVGPFFHNSQTGNVGAYLIVLGLSLRGRNLPAFVFVGSLALLLTSSRTSMVAAVVGASVALALGPYRWNRRVSLPIRLASIGVVASSVTLVAVFFSPNLTGRDTYWAYYSELWRSSPWIGVGVTGRNSGPEEFYQVNGHNLVIDALGIYGLPAGILVLLVIVLAFILTTQSARLGEGTAIALLVTFCTIGLTQSDYNWTVASVPWLMLLVSILLAAATISSKRSSEAVQARGTNPAEHFGAENHVDTQERRPN